MDKRQSAKGDIDFSKLDPGLTSEGEIGPAGSGGSFLDRLSPGVRTIVSRLLSIVKLVLGLCFLAFVYTGSFGFLKELRNAAPSLQKDFWSGVITFVIIYLFFYEPMKLYQKGQKLLTFIFKFFAPLVRFAPFVLPVYTIIVFALYPLVHMIWKDPLILEYFIFVAGMTVSFHLIMTAKSLKTRQGDFLKANYIFGFSLVYILNLLLVAICFQLLLDKFSFYNFWTGAYEESQRIWHAAFTQIFIPGPK